MDEQLYLAGLGLSLPEKVEKAIATFRHYEPEALKFDPRGYRVGDSFGKDSCALLELCRMAGVKYWAAHSLTTLDAPETIYFGRKYHPKTVIERSPSGMTLLSMLANIKTTLPTRGRRWCCSIYKEYRNGLVNAFGIRATESNSRRNWKIWSPHIETKDWTLNPILYWSEDNIWQFLRKNNVPYCSLYDEGFKRLGCVGCPMSNNRRKEFERWPRYEKAWRKSVAQYWERLHNAKRRDGEYYHCHKFKSADDLWSWWMEEMPKEDKGDECQMGLF